MLKNSSMEKITVRKINFLELKAFKILIKISCTIKNFLHFRVMCDNVRDLRAISYANDVKTVNR